MDSDLDEDEQQYMAKGHLHQDDVQAEPIMVIQPSDSYGMRDTHQLAHGSNGDLGGQLGRDEQDLGAHDQDYGEQIDQQEQQDQGYDEDKQSDDDVVQ